MSKGSSKHKAHLLPPGIPFDAHVSAYWDNQIAPFFLADVQRANDEVEAGLASRTAKDRAVISEENIKGYLAPVWEARAKALLRGGSEADVEAAVGEKLDDAAGYYRWRAAATEKTADAVELRNLVLAEEPLSRARVLKGEGQKSRPAKRIEQLIHQDIAERLTLRDHKVGRRKVQDILSGR
jgi:hypothetical protein